MAKTVLVTGAAGFIGCNTSKLFSQSGYKVIGLDNLSREGSEENLRWLLEECPPIDFELADVRDSAKVETLVRNSKPDLVVHLAAQVAVTTSISNPRHDFEVNALGTLNVLEAVRLQSSSSRLIFSSTNKVYGDLEAWDFVSHESRYLPVGRESIDEKEPLSFHSPYGCSKGAADQYVSDYSRLFGMQAVSLRQSCIYGQRQFGVEDQGWVAWFALSGIRGLPVTIYGSGRQVRDLLYVDDLVDLYLRIAESENFVPGAFNVGGGYRNSSSLLELIAVLKDEQGIAVEASFADWRQGDQKYFVSDNSAVEAAYRWRPSVTIKSGLERLASWLRTLDAG